MNICTIIAYNYLAHARVLAASFRDVYPASTCVVLVLDEHEGHFRDDEPFTVVRPRDLPFSSGEFEDMVLRYGVLELSTAVKPWLLRYMLEHYDEGGGVAYFDPDIRVFRGLSELERAMETQPIVLTPHITEPMPRDGRVPNEQALLVAGTYNLGFIGLRASPQADQLLEWWGERLRTECLVAPAEGFFVDQRWIDFVPGLIPETHILHDPAYNVAYWNVATRSLARDDVSGGYTVNGAPLRFFHFSGYSPDEPTQLSKHQNRIALDTNPGLNRICAEYREELFSAGYASVSELPYTLEYLSSGLRIDPVIREVYRCARDRRFLEVPAGEAELVAWLRGPAPEAAGTSRYLHAFWHRREDLRRAFPDPGSGDRDAFHRWCREEGRNEIPTPLLPTTSDGAHAVSRVDPVSALHRSRPIGVNVVGYMRAELGVGEIARQVVSGLDVAGYPVYPLTLPVPSSRQEHHFVASDDLESAPFDLSLVCVNADMVPAFAEAAGPRFFAGRYTIGLWWWEVATVPAFFEHAFHHIDELWVGSRFIADALAEVSPIPVLCMPPPLEWSAAVGFRPGEHGWPDAFTFLYAFDYNSVFSRKNPLGVVDAYTQAFGPDDGAALVLKCINRGQHADAHARVLDAVAGRPDIVMIDEYLPTADKDRLIASCDCYVSLHRSEGFGLTMAEAMHHGKPVIATGYSGNVDFVTNETGWLVKYDLQPVGEGSDPYPPNAVWAQPDIDGAAQAMRAAHSDPRGAARRGQAGARAIREQYAPAVAGRAMRDRLELLRQRLPDGRPTSEIGDWISGTADDARATIDLRTHFPGARSRIGPVGALSRSSVRRAILPYTYHQDRINRDLADQVMRGEQRTADALTALQARLAGFEAALLQDGRTHRSETGKRVDRLTTELRELQESSEAFGDGLRRLQARARELPTPAEPWTHEYNALHRAFVGVALDDPEFQRWFSARESLPARYGVGLDERVVEYPWLRAQGPHGRVLDAGSVLNHRHILERFSPLFDSLTIATLVTEDETFPSPGIRYVDADLRELPFADDSFDTTVCLSTLEHVGMDNTYYGAGQEIAPASRDPAAEARRALAEVLRVTRAGGRVLLSVPFGRSERLGWLRVFGAGDLDELLAGVAEDRRTVEVFRYHEDGWRRATVEEASGARYRDYTADPAPVEDDAAAARAVACVTIAV